MHKIFSISLSLTVVAGLATLSARTWTDTKGRQLEADIVSKTGDSVTVSRSDDGKEYTIPLDTLSEADQAFVKSWKPEEEKADNQPKSATGKGEVKEEYFTAAWPTLISGDLNFDIEEDRGESGEYIYRSPHYEFIANAELSTMPVKRFAVLFEATKSYVQALPLGKAKAHQKKGERYKIYLFETKEQYVRAGGPASSAGVYMTSKDIIMVPFESLGLIEAAGGWRVDYDKTNKTLPHEITHQLTDLVYYADGYAGWYTEGLAEYVAVTPYRSGKFSVNKVARAVEEYTTGFSRADNRGRNIGTDVNAPDLQEFMNMDYGKFAGSSGDTVNFNYAFGALLVTYFCHYDGKGDAANLKNFLRAMSKGVEYKEAQKQLLAGRTFEELEEDISKEWSKRGVKITFR